MYVLHGPCLQLCTIPTLYVSVLSLQNLLSDSEVLLKGMLEVSLCGSLPQRTAPHSTVHDDTHIQYVRTCPLSGNNWFQLVFIHRKLLSVFTTSPLARSKTCMKKDCKLLVNTSESSLIIIMYELEVGGQNSSPLSTSLNCLSFPSLLFPPPSLPSPPLSSPPLSSPPLSSPPLPSPPLPSPPRLSAPHPSLLLMMALSAKYSEEDGGSQPPPGETADENDPHTVSNANGGGH